MGLGASRGTQDLRYMMEPGLELGRTVRVKNPGLSCCLFVQGDRGFDGLPGLPGEKGQRVSVGGPSPCPGPLPTPSSEASIPVSDSSPFMLHLLSGGLVPTSTFSL